MADVFISDQKRKALADEMQRLGIREDALIEKFILGSGKGGQKINKTSSCVYLKDPEHDVEVKCQRSRSRDANRFLARRALCEKLKERLEGERSKRQEEQEKIRRQKRRRSRRAKQRMLEDKHIQSKKKATRRSVDASGHGE
ncbi:MAG: peptide chain release factor-like protein [Verrucomicrobia bacterium]|nr:peptide chain release factor-like protein [Verrucomicrobiota bacterium]